MGKKSSTGKPDKFLHTADIVSIVDTTKKRALEHAVWQRIRNHIDEYHKMGALPRNDPDGVRGLIRDVFADYYRDERESVREETYQALAGLLCLCGIAQPAMLTDWSIARVHEAEKALGIRSFQALELTLGETMANPDDHRLRREPRCRHLHKGPGNGALMYYLRKGRIDRQSPRPSAEDLEKDRMFLGTPYEDQRTEYWEEIGLGDRLYFSIERLLQRFVQDDTKNDLRTRAVIRVLSTALQHGLRDHWFEEIQEPETMAPTLKPKRRVDLNDIILFLANPKQWMTDADLFARGEHRVSKEFERDDTSSLAVGSDEWLLNYMGSNSPEAMRRIRARRIESLKEAHGKIASLRQEMNQMRSEHGRLTRSGNPPPEESDAPQKKVLLGRSHEIFVKYGLEATIAQCWGDIPNALKEADVEIRNLRKNWKRQRYGMPINAQESTNDPIDCLAKIFNEEFVAALRDHERYTEPNYRKDRTLLNLNRRGAEMYIHNFVPGKFDEMTTIFPANSFMLMTSTRGDSHETDAAFLDDIRKNLIVLEPGGILLTDGIRQSGSRVYRLQQIKEAVGTSREFTTEVVMDVSTHDLVSILIQKRHPTADNGGFLTHEQQKNS